MLPRFIVSPAAALAAALALLAISALARFPFESQRGVLDEDWMPAWQKRDLGLLDGRAPRGVEGVRPR